MSDLKDLLQGAGEAKRQLFTSEDFAGGYGRSVVSRVKRRRVVTATAMGGGTVVAAGAIAFGASNVSWSGFVMGPSPSGSPSVVCTTPTPSADNALSALGYPMPSGSLGWAVAVGSQDPPNIVANIFLDLHTREVTGSLPSRSPSVLTRGADGVYAMELSDGNVLEFEVTDDNLVLKSSSLEPTGQPAVTCVTATPHPSQSASPVPQLSSTTSASAAPSASPSVEAEAVDSPFFCGSEIAAEEYGTPELRIGKVTWVSSDSAKAEAELWSGSESSTWPAEGDVLRVVAEGNWLASADARNLDWANGSEDPVVFASGDDFAWMAEDNVDDVWEGLNFVAVRDGVVIATLPRTETEQNPHVFIGSGEAPAINPTGLFLNADGAWTECEGEKLDKEWALYAVAGVTLRHADGAIDEPLYAWTRIEIRQLTSQVVLDQLLCETNIRTRGEVGKPLSHVVGQAKAANERTDRRLVNRLPAR